METFSVHSLLSPWPFLRAWAVRHCWEFSYTLKGHSAGQKVRGCLPHRRTTNTLVLSLTWSSINAQLGPEISPGDVSNDIFPPAFESRKGSIKSYKGLNFRDGCLTFGVPLWCDLCSSSPNIPRVSVTISLLNSHLPRSCHGEDKRGKRRQ